MKAIPYYIDKHKIQLIEVLKLRGLDPRLADDTPRCGFIALQEGKPVAFCFLREVEGGYGMIDGYMSNPQMDGPTRHRGLDLVLHLVLKTTKRHNLKAVLGFTVYPEILSRAIRSGFTVLKHTLVSLTSTP